MQDRINFVSSITLSHHYRSDRAYTDHAMEKLATEVGRKLVSALMLNKGLPISVMLEEKVREEPYNYSTVVDWTLKLRSIPVVLKSASSYFNDDSSAHPLSFPEKKEADFSALHYPPPATSQLSGGTPVYSNLTLADLQKTKAILAATFQTAAAAGNELVAGFDSLASSLPKEPVALKQERKWARLKKPVAPKPSDSETKKIETA